MSTVAAITLTVWDMLLTVEAERKYIWQFRWSFIKFIYIIVRYLALSLQIVNGIALYSTFTLSDPVCSAFKWFQGLGRTTLAAVVEIILIYRIFFSFWEHQRALLYFFIALYLCSEAAIFTLTGLFMHDYIWIQNPVVQYRPLIGDCVPLVFPRKLIFVWIVLAVQCIRLVYTHYGTWSLGIPHTRLYAVFLRDGIWAYSITVVTLVLCIIYTEKESPIGFSLTSWLFTTSIICACRMIFNLRAIHNEPASTVSLSMPMTFVQMRGQLDSSL